MVWGVQFMIVERWFWWILEDIVGGGWFFGLEAVLGGAPGRVGGAAQKVGGG